jgi:4-diphosphocytidyl-2-C-methyl-D-erythritol kinase
MKSKAYRLKSPAKINIGLNVLNKRRDGYHNIETIFYPVKLYDEIKIRITEIENTGNKITVKTNPQSGIDGKNNICYRTAILFFDEFKIKEKYNIEIGIRKRIPIGAGLGGGSSNAAAVLKLLAKYFKKENQVLKIKSIALKPGSDVPFFLLCKPAFGSSRGEKLTLLPKFKIKYDILIVNPKIHVSTAWAYNILKGKSKKAKGKNELIQKLKKIEKFSIKDKEIYRNDFEKVVFKRYPAIGKIKEMMYKEGAAFSSMSGSGSTVFGFFEKNITKASKYFKDKGYRVFIIKK